MGDKWGIRRRGRELALHFLFSLDMRGLLAETAAGNAKDAEDAFAVFCEHFGEEGERADRAAPAGFKKGEDFFRPFALRNWEIERCFQFADRREGDFCRALAADPGARRFARTLALGALRHRDELDARIVAHARNWRLERMSAVDRNILRIAAFELTLADADAPPRVVINEALEIAKRYGIAESAAFINGILDGIRRALPPRTTESRAPGGKSGAPPFPSRRS